MSRVFIRDPWKYWTLVCRFFKSLSRSRSGVELKENTFRPNIISDLKRPVEENHFNVDILPVLMEKILQEVWHCLVWNVSTDNDMPDSDGYIFIIIVNFSEIVFKKPSPCFLLVGALILRTSPNQFNNFRDAWGKHCLMTEMEVLIKYEILTKPTRMNKVIAIFPKTVWHDMSP